MRPFAPTLAQRLAFNIRQYILTLMVPIGVLLGAYDLYELLPESALRYLEGAVGGGAAAFRGGTRRLHARAHHRGEALEDAEPSEGAVRERLASLCARAGVRFRDIRVWETPGHHIVNAAVMGIAGFVRYIIVSRTLLEVMAPDEIEAVFAHELGHARRRHMIYYLLFAADFVLLLNLYDMLTPEEMRAATDTGATAYFALAARRFLLLGARVRVRIARLRTGRRPLRRRHDGRPEPFRVRAHVDSAPQRHQPRRALMAARLDSEHA